MDNIQERLAGCFLAVFPGLNTDEIIAASSRSVENWDSVAGVTLLAVVEEEFEISIEVDDLARFNSYKGFLDYLQGPEAAGQAGECGAEQTVTVGAAQSEALLQ